MYRLFRISPDKKEIFKSKFTELFKNDIFKFNGEQPLISWYDDGNTFSINIDFLNSLPKISMKDLEQLIKSLQ